MLTLERREERLAHRVVVGIADRAYRRLHTDLATTQTEGDRRILATLVRVVDDGRGATLYTVIETAKLHSIDPAAYLRAAIIAADRGELLLPAQFAEQRPSSP